MSKSERVAADGKVYEIVASSRASGLGAGQRGLVTHDGHEGSRQNAACAFHNGAGDAAQSLLRLQARCKGAKQAEEEGCDYEKEIFDFPAHRRKPPWSSSSFSKMSCRA